MTPGFFIAFDCLLFNLPDFRAKLGMLDLIFFFLLSALMGQAIRTCWRLVVR